MVKSETITAISASRSISPACASASIEKQAEPERPENGTRRKENHRLRQRQALYERGEHGYRDKQHADEQIQEIDPIAA